MILRWARRQDRIGFVKRKIHAFLQMGLRKDPRHSDVPLALDLAKSEQDREALELMTSPSLFARPFIAPPDIPKEWLEAAARGLHEYAEGSRAIGRCSENAHSC
jgi:hypothetical protein